MLAPAPECLICDLTYAINRAYQEASWNRRAMVKVAKMQPALRDSPFARAIDVRCADVAKDLFAVTKHAHSSTVRRE